MRFSFGVTESFNQRNQGATVAESLESAQRIVAHAREDGLRSTVTLSVPLGCPFEGEVDPDPRRRDRDPGGSSRARHAGPRGHDRRRVPLRGAAPRRPALLRSATGRGPFPQHPLRERAAAVGAGATVLDASIGGLGGCPVAPNATGNIAAEDLVYALHREGIETGVDLDALLEIADWMAERLGRRLEGQLYRAGAFPPR